MDTKPSPLPAPGSAQLAMRVYITGKVLRVRRHERFFYTTIISPAKDEYSRPNIVEVRSVNRFADVDEPVKVNAELGGYEGKNYQVLDKETGERRSLIPVNLYLDLVV